LAIFKPKKHSGQPRAYAFIDSQNLNLGTQKAGWKMDWRKYRRFLREKYNVTNAYMFIGYMQEFEDIYKQLHDAGFLVVLKPTQDLSKPQEEKSDQQTEKPEDKKIIKGNIDADLVLWAMKELKNYDKAIIVSGDGDFHSLIEYLVSQNKLLHIMTPNWQFSQLLKEFESYIVRIDKLRHELEYRNSRPKHNKQS